MNTRQLLVRALCCSLFQYLREREREWVCVCVCVVSPLQLQLVCFRERENERKQRCLCQEGSFQMCVYENRNVCQMCLNHFTVISHTHTHAHIERQKESRNPFTSSPFTLSLWQFPWKPCLISVHVHIYFYAICKCLWNCQRQVHGTVYDKVNKHQSRPLSRSLEPGCHTYVIIQ